MQQAASHATALAIPAREEAEPAVSGTGGVPALLASVAIRPPASDRADRWVWAAALSLALMAHAAILFALAHKAADFMAGGGGQQIDAISVTLVNSDVLESRQVERTAAGRCRRGGLGREHRRGPREQPRGSRGAARGEERAAGGAEGEAQGRADPRGRSHHRGAEGSTEAEEAGKRRPGGWRRRRAQRYRQRRQGQRAGSREPRRRARIRPLRGAGAAKTKPKGAGGLGTVRVKFVIAGDGELAAVEVAKSSGSPKLDDVALEAVRRTKFLVPPAGMTTAQLTYEVPYHFR